MNGENPKFALLLIPAIGLISILIFPYLLTRSCRLFADFSDTGPIGDTIGGIANPFIALLAALLTFLAFWVQMRSNKAQTEQFSKIDKETNLKQFQSHYYELLQLHKANVDEFKLGKSSGRKIFLPLIKEYKYCYFLIELMQNAEKEINPNFTVQTKEELMNIAYLVFFFGIGDNSNLLIEALNKNFNTVLVKSFIDELEKKRKSVANTSDNYEFQSIDDRTVTLKIGYTPFEGHMSRLGHYYRHLFQMVKHVVEQDDDIVIDKYKYLKTIRAQLSSHEQILLYFNGMSDLGKVWIEKEYFTKYRMIKNIPIPLIDYGKSPNEKFEKLNNDGKYIFEWDELLDK